MQINVLKEKEVLSLNEWNSFQVDKLRLKKIILNVVNVVPITGTVVDRFRVFYTELEEIIEFQTNSTTQA